MLMESGTCCHRVTLPKRDLEPEPEPLKSEPEPKLLISEQEPKLTSETNDPEESDESYSNKAHFEFIKDYRRRQAADKAYLEKSRKLSVSICLINQFCFQFCVSLFNFDSRQHNMLQRYDAIPRPRRSLLCGGRPIRPLDITERNLPVFKDLSSPSAIFQAKVVVDTLDQHKDPSVEECKIKI
jgi:hypothetical protein